MAGARRDYRPELEKASARRGGGKVGSKQKEMERLVKDLKVGRPEKEGLNVMSDIESGDEEMGLVGRDGDEEMAPEEKDDEGLKQRYEKALREASGKKDTKLEEGSMQRYLRTAHG